jgi:predicted DsbA family dithiol-disulfide isomerase
MLAGKYNVSAEQVEVMEGRVAEAAASEGLGYRSDRLHTGTFDVHRVLHLAKARGAQDELLTRLYRANFAEARPIGEDDTLVEVATAAGLDESEVRAVLADPTAYADAVRADQSEATELGITAVPFFVIDRRYGISGGQPAEVFTQALEQAAAAGGLTLVADDSAPVCDDGSCEVPAEK